MVSLKKKNNNSSLLCLLEAEKQNSNHPKKFSFWNCHVLSTGIWTADSGSVIFTWLGYAIWKKEIHPIFLPWKMEIFIPPCEMPTQ